MNKNWDYYVDYLWIISYHQPVFSELVHPIFLSVTWAITIISGLQLWRYAGEDHVDFQNTVGRFRELHLRSHCDGYDHPPRACCHPTCLIMAWVCCHNMATFFGNTMMKPCRLITMWDCTKQYPGTITIHWEHSYQPTSIKGWPVLTTVHLLGLDIPMGIGQPIFSHMAINSCSNPAKRKNSIFEGFPPYGFCTAHFPPAPKIIWEEYRQLILASSFTERSLAGSYQTGFDKIFHRIPMECWWYESHPPKHIPMVNGPNSVVSSHTFTSIWRNGINYSYGYNIYIYIQYIYMYIYVYI